MKRLLILCAFLAPVCFSNAQTYVLPEADIQDVNGNTINSSTFENGGKPIIISFWATWCKPCIQELVTVADLYEEWQEETGVKVIAVSIDDARNVAKVGPFVQGKAWEYEVYCDPNGDLKRALSVNTIPHTFLLDSNKNIVWQHINYTPGDEIELYELVKKLAKGEPIE